MSEPSKAVFLSYASQDAEAARRISDALRSAGVEVWFDADGGLEHGDEWDAKIRRQIKECLLFIPLISANTQAREEGYFRIEWELAAQRAMGFASGVAFILPVVVDETREPDALVPDRFRSVQWTRLKGGVMPPDVMQRFLKLWSHRAGLAKHQAEPSRVSAAPIAPPPASSSKRTARISGLVGAVVVGIATALWVSSRPKAGPEPSATRTPPSPAAVAASPDSSAGNSVAVLPFTNLSDDKENEYFSDGISEELLTVLQKIPGLHVAARTSSFYFKGRNATTQEIGAKLGVRQLIAGSVRKSGHQVRVSVQLSHADTGEQIWSESYTRDLKDVFALQTELAQTIVEQLRKQLGGDVTANVAAQVEAAERGGTHNADAHQLYLQGRYYAVRFSLDDLNRAVGFFQKAVDLDAHYARAWAALSQAASLVAGYANTRAEFNAANTLAAKAADQALALDSELAVAHLAKGDLQAGPAFEWKGAIQSYQRALELAPNDADVLIDVGRMAYTENKLDRALDYFSQCERLDPANPAVRIYRGFALMAASRMTEAKAEFQEVIALNPSSPWSYGGVCQVLVLEGQYDEALAYAQKSELAWARRFCVALAQSGRNDPAAAASLNELIKEDADVAAYQIAETYALRGEADHAFEWLDRAYRQGDPGLAWLLSDRLFARIHDDSRWPPFVHKVGLAPDQLQ